MRRLAARAHASPTARSPPFPFRAGQGATSGRETYLVDALPVVEGPGLARALFGLCDAHLALLVLGPLLLARLVALLLDACLLVDGLLGLRLQGAGRGGGVGRTGRGRVRLRGGDGEGASVLARRPLSERHPARSRGSGAPRLTILTACSRWREEGEVRDRAGHHRRWRGQAGLRRLGAFAPDGSPAAGGGGHRGVVIANNTLRLASTRQGPPSRPRAPCRGRD